MSLLVLWGDRTTDMSLDLLTLVRELLFFLPLLDRLLLDVIGR
ncbi:MAG TPA: hypothetical protein V6C78_26000 [Crinalium sp.]